jgi:hypothetical protein
MTDTEPRPPQGEVAAGLAHIDMLARFNQRNPALAQSLLQSHRHDLDLLGRALHVLYLAATCQRKCWGGSFGDLKHVVSEKPARASGWRLEYFMADLVMKCRQGRAFESMQQEDDIFALFNRRSGPIAAAISVTIEQSGD